LYFSEIVSLFQSTPIRASPSLEKSMFDILVTPQYA
jgi:hypothetical protein